MSLWFILLTITSCMYVFNDHLDIWRISHWWQLDISYYLLIRNSYCPTYINFWDSQIWHRPDYRIGASYQPTQFHNSTELEIERSPHKFSVLSLRNDTYAVPIQLTSIHILNTTYINPFAKGNTPLRDWIFEICYRQYYACHIENNFFPDFLEIWKCLIQISRKSWRNVFVTSPWIIVSALTCLYIDTI